MKILSQSDILLNMWRLSTFSHGRFYLLRSKMSHLVMNWGFSVPYLGRKSYFMPSPHLNIYLYVHLCPPSGQKQNVGKGNFTVPGFILPRSRGRARKIDADCFKSLGSMPSVCAPRANWENSAAVQRAGLFSPGVLVKIMKRICAFSLLSLKGTSVLWVCSSFNLWEQEA